MNGEEEHRVHEHVHAESVSLRSYFEALLTALEQKLDERARSQKEAVDAALLAAKEAVNAALAAAEKAVVTARTSQERVNEKQNEFRQALVDQQQTFMPRETFEQAMQEVARRLEVLEGLVGRSAGSETGAEQARVRLFGMVLAAAAVVSAVVAAVAFALSR